MIVRPVVDADRATWERLYGGYASFYEVPTPDLDLLWDWIHDGRMTCLVAELDGKVVGFAHLREFIRPLRGVRAGYLDDLYVEAAARGGGVGRALLDAARDLARERGWAVVRWMTAESNATAQRLYDGVAGRVTGWLTYDTDPHGARASDHPAPR